MFELIELNHLIMKFDLAVFVMIWDFFCVQFLLNERSGAKCKNVIQKHCPRAEGNERWDREYVEASW